MMHNNLNDRDFLKLPDNHLQSPLTNNLTKYIVNSDDSLIFEDNTRRVRVAKNVPLFLHNDIININNFLKNFYGHEKLDCIDLLPKMLLFETNKFFLNTSLEKSILNGLRLSSSLIAGIMEKQKLELKCDITPEDYTNLKDRQGMKNVIKYSNCLDDLLRLRDMMKEQKIKSITENTIPIHTACKIMHYGVHINENFILFYESSKTKIYILDYNHLLMICDTFYSRYLTYLHISLYLKMYKIKIIPIDILSQIYKWGDEVLSEHKNGSFDTFKLLEALCVRRLIQLKDHLKCTEDFPNQIKSGLQSLHQNCQAHATIIDILDNISDPLIISEIYGLFRHWGHPIVDECAGVKKVTKIAKGKKNHWKGGYLLRCSISRLFVISFIKKNGRWPRCNLSQSMSKNSIVRKWKEKNITVINETVKDYLWTDWGYIIFEKELPFDPYLDFSILLDDKSLSPPRQFFDSVYDNNVLGYKTEKLDAEFNRKMLINMLNRDDFETEKLLRKIQFRVLESYHYIIGLHPKEREAKIEARLFAMMTMEMRYYFCITEHNLSDQLFPYLHQQTMTSSEVELTQRLLDITKVNDSPGGYIHVYLSLDFSSWNIRWDYSSTYQTFKFLDEIFGMENLYTFTHEFFSKCHCYLSSRFNIPTQTEKLTLDFREIEGFIWNNHEGGFEGLRQKGWTICTIALIEIAHIMSDTKGYITGQGDNQMIKLMIKNPSRTLRPSEAAFKYQEYINDKVSNYLTILRNLSESVGQKLKIEETFVSTNVFIFGKEILFSGSMLPGCLKKAARIFDDTNNIVHTTSNKIATIQTGGQSAAQKALSFLIPFTHANIETYKSIYNSLFYDDITKKEGKNTVERSKIDYFKFCEFLSVLPSALGGFPLINFADYIFRGHPDPITATLSCLELGRKHDMNFNLAYKIMAYIPTLIHEKTKNLSLKEKEKFYQKNKKMMITDPTNFCQQQNIGTHGCLRVFLETLFIDKPPKNSTIHKLFYKGFKEDDNEFKDWLCTITPFVPRVLSTLYQNSPGGARTSFLGSFGSIRTLMQISSVQNQQSLSSNILKNEVEKWSYFCSLYKLANRLKDTNIGCHTKFIQKVRDLLVGESCYYITVPHPLHLMKFLSTNDPILSFVSITIPHDSPNYENVPNINPLLTTRGKTHPYLGSKTREKVSNKLISVDRVDKPLHSAMRLSQITNWITNDTTYLHKCMNYMVEMRTNIDKGILQYASGKIVGGSVSHRFADTVTKHHALTTVRPNFLTHLVINTDNFYPYSTTDLDYNVHFQGIILNLCSLVSESIVKYNPTKNKKTSWVQHISCEECIQQIDEKDMDSPNEIPKSLKPIYTHILYSYEYNILQDEVMWFYKDLSYFSVVSKSTPKEVGEAIGSNIAKTCSAVLSHISNYKTSGIVDFIRSEFRVQDIIYAKLSNIVQSVIGYIYIYSIKDILSFMVDHMEPSKIGIQSIADLVLADEPELFFGQLTKYIPLLIKHDAVDLDFLHSCCHFPKGANGGPDCAILINDHYKKYYPIMLKRFFKWENKIKLYISSKESINSMPYLIVNIIYIKLHIRDNSTSNDLLKKIREAHTYITSTKQSSSCPSMFKLTSKFIENMNINLLDHIIVVSTPSEEIMRMRLEGSESEKITDHKFVCITLDTSNILMFNYNVDTKYFNQTSTLPISNFILSPNIDESIPTIKMDHLFKLTGFCSSAHYKFFEIISHNKIPIKERNVMTIGEGVGGISNMIAMIFQPKQIFYNSLVSKANVHPERLGSIVAPETLMNKNNLQIINSVIGVISGGDILKDDTVIYLSQCKVDLITSDVDYFKTFSSQDSICYVTNVMKICKNSLSNNGYLILKLYANNPSVCALQIYIISQTFDSIKLQIPVFSSYEVHEFFVVCTNILPNASIPTFTHTTLNHYRDIIDNIRSVRLKQRYPFQLDNLYYSEQINNYLLNYYVFNINYVMEHITLGELNKLDLSVIEDTMNKLIDKYCNTIHSYNKFSIEQKLNFGDQQNIHNHTSKIKLFEELKIKIFNLLCVKSIILFQKNWKKEMEKNIPIFITELDKVSLIHKYRIYYWKILGHILYKCKQMNVILM